MADASERPFIHLHLHSAYSLAEGAIRINEIRDLCLTMDMPAVAVTDTNNLFGALEASEVLSGSGIQPITGLQLSLSPTSTGLAEERTLRTLPSLVLLAQNEIGYKHLMALSSAVFLRPASEEYPCVDLKSVLTAHEGLICMTGGYHGPVDQLLRLERHQQAEQLVSDLKSAFGDRLYMEVQRHPDRTETGTGTRNAGASPTEGSLLNLAYSHDIPLVATNEPYFPSKDDYDAHDALLCIAEGAYVHQDDRTKVTEHHFFKSGTEMRELFSDLPEAIDHTTEIAQRCAFRPRLHSPILPNFLDADDNTAPTINPQASIAPPTHTPHDEHRKALEMQALTQQAKAGLEERLANVTLAADRSAYDERLAVELDIIGSMGFPGYFLIVADFIQWAKAHDIPVGPGRGSGAGSLVAWALTITDLDPLRFGLLFERFLNPERVSMPDFDVDFCQDRRDEVIQYVQEKYGHDRVAQIITFGKLQARAVLRDVGRVLNMPFGQVDRLCKLVPNNPANPVTLQEALDTEPRLQEEVRSEESVNTLVEKALKLEGLYRHASTHAAGVVIGDRPLEDLVALYLDPRSDMPATQFNMKWVEPAGLVKFDFLGLKTLTVINRAVQFLANRGIDIDITAIPLDDEKTFQMLGDGHATGVFQLESAGMRATLKSMKPDSLEDIIALVSLYRPGPMENIPDYIDRKQGRQEPDYLHPKLEGVLKETYGVIIYQEQVMQIAQILSGYSLGEADLLRRAMGKKKKEEMDRQRKRFVDGARENGVEEAKASSIFDLVQKFAGYGFNKSHAAAYALIAYQTAWLKANYPAEFLAASMSLDRTNTDKLAIFLKEAKRSDILVRPPHINYSLEDFSVEDGAILYALSAVKNVGETAMEQIASERLANGSYKDIHDFCERLDLKQVGKRAFENLARAGAFDGLVGSRRLAFDSSDILIRASACHQEEIGSAQAGLFQQESAPTLDRPKLPAVEEWMPMDRLVEEFNAIGFYFSGHPLDDYERELARMNVRSFTSVTEAVADGDTTFHLAAVIRDVKVRRSKNGNPFAWVECSDASGEYEVTVFSRVLDANRDLLEPGRLVLLTVSADSDDRDDVRLLVEAVANLDQAAAQTASRLRISLGSVAALEGIQRRLNAVKPVDQKTTQSAAPTHNSASQMRSSQQHKPQNSTAAPHHSDQGDIILAFRLPETGREVEVLLPNPVSVNPQMRAALKAVDGVYDVELL